MSNKDFIIETNKYNSIILKKYIGTDSKVIVPNEVMVIGEDAFRGLDFVEEIFLPRGVFCIDTCAFAECKNLKRVEIKHPEPHFEKTPFLNSGEDFEIIFDSGMAQFEEAAGKVFVSSEDFSSGDYHHPSATHFEYYKIVTYTHIFSSDEYKPFTCTVKCTNGELVYHERPYETRKVKST